MAHTEDDLLKESRRTNAEIELFVQSSSSAVFSSKSARASARDFSYSKGHAVRVIRSGRMGFASFEKEKEFRKSVDAALRLSRQQEKAGYFFASRARAVSRKFYDPAAADAGYSDLLANVESMDSGHSRGVVGIVNLSGRTRTSQLLLSSEGARVSQEFSNFFAYSHCSSGGAEGDHAQSSSRPFDAGPVARTAAAAARAMRAPVKPASGVIPVVFDARALHSLFELFLPFHFSGESFRRKLTRLREGGRFLADGLSLLDDPRVPGSENSAEYDDEGFKTAPLPLAESGAATNFLFDMRTAVRCGKKPGNGVRASYSSQPQPAFTNAVVEGGRLPDAVSECRRGVYVTSFLTSGANDVTGDFGFPLLTAFEIRNGELGRGLKGSVLRGNFFEVMRHAGFERKRERFGNLVSGRAAFRARLVS
ncbi:MAG: metallopeptidase TldD-related protein [Candidatus Micrarchaeota archaeon]